MELSKKGQDLWDKYGAAYENHVDTSAEPTSTKDERVEAAGKYLQAARELHDYIATIEDKAWKYDSLNK